MNLLSSKDIDKISYDILRASKSLDVFPTPVDKIVAYSELEVRKDVDISRIHTGFFAKTTDALRRALTKVRGMLDRTERTIYLDLSQGDSRKNFVKLHEVGHDVLPWQRDIHSLLDDDDDSLSADTHEEFEAEANYFASATLFQHDRFLAELDKLGLGLDSAIQLSKHFGASIHAALRRYVEYSKNACALIVLENSAESGARRKCALRNMFSSNKFSRSFGSINIPVELSYTLPFVQDYYRGRKFLTDGRIALPTNSGDLECNYHFFNNGYNAFVFLFPVGEKKSTRTKIIITSSAS